MSIFGKYLGAGDFRETIAIQLRTETTDGVGGIIDGTPTTVAAMRANVMPIRGQELASLAGIDGAINRASVDYRIWIRRPPSLTITPEHAIAWRGKDLDIVSVIEPAMERRYLELMCKERIVS
jgi:SPP1 family predicted phage head-tail adaptor